jgi:hypothetical protein
VQDCSLDVNRPEEFRVDKLMDDATDAHGIELVLIAYQDVVVGEALDILK